jgi:hypothetical protein
MNRRAEQCRSSLPVGVYTYFRNNGSSIWPEDVRTVNIQSTVAAIQVNGYLYGDAKTTSSSSTTTISTSSNSAVSPSNTTPSVALNTSGASTGLTNIASSSDKDSGFLPSAKISIGIGVSVGVIGIAALLIVGLIWRKRRMGTRLSERKLSTVNGLNSDATMDDSAFAHTKTAYIQPPSDVSLAMLPKYRVLQVYEIGMREPQEMPVERRQHELP